MPVSSLALRPAQRVLPAAFAPHAERNLPRYTSYPTALAFDSAVDEAAARGWAAGVGPETPISVYVHVPFCDQLCWYCGCHTTVPNGYRRVAGYLEQLHREIDLWAKALGEHAGAAHLHFGGGSPNALKPADFLALARHLREAFRVQPDAEVAIELDPRALDEAFVEALQAAGVNRASLGVQTFDPAVQRKVNRIQPYDHVAWATRALRAAGVTGLSFDLMYGLPGQTAEVVEASAELAADLDPDRISVFGYAHVPWFKKHQRMIDEAELEGLDGRWAQAEAADLALVGAGYERIGLDHYARPDDPLAKAARTGALRRNFQGYTTDAAEVLIPLGPSAIGRFPQGYVQNSREADAWTAAIDAGRLPVDRGVGITAEDRLRARAIERLMCDLKLDAGAVCLAEGCAADALDRSVAQASALSAEGLCEVEGRHVIIPEPSRRLMRTVAACFDARLASAERRHSKAV